MFAQRVLARSGALARSFSVFETKNTIKATRSKYYANPAVGKFEVGIFSTKAEAASYPMQPAALHWSIASGCRKRKQHHTTPIVSMRASWFWPHALCSVPVLFFEHWNSRYVAYVQCRHCI